MDTYYIYKPQRPTPAEMIMLLNCWMVAIGRALYNEGHWEEIRWFSIPVKS